MKCLICNYENSEDSLFCMSCGSRIPRCPTCGRLLTDRDRFCVYDGTPIPEDILALIPEPDVAQLEETAVDQVIFGVQSSLEQEYAPKVCCMNCGAPCASGEELCDACKVELSSRKAQRKPRKKKKQGWIVVLILVLLLLAGSIILGVAIHNGDVELPFLAADTDREDKDDDDDRNTGKDPDDDLAGAGENDGADGDTDEENPGDASGEDVTAVTEAPTDEPTEEPTEAPTEESTEAPTEAGPEKGTLEYFVMYCDTVYFTEEDLEGFTAEECRIARNACYAHSGRMFSDPQLQDYFKQFDWYEPVYTPENFPESALNPCQKANIQLVSGYESEMGYR